MNVFILCIFALVPFHNASVHEAKLTVCPDFAEALRFENTLESYQAPEPPNPAMESVLKATPPVENDPTQTLEPKTALTQTVTPKADPTQTGASKSYPTQTLVPEDVSELNSLGQLKPEIVPEKSIELKQPIVESEKAAEPAPLEIPESLTPKPLSPSENVVFAAAEEPIPGAQPVPAGVKAQETMPTDVPIRRPWGVLMFFIFLLMLSISANVFLGWQLIEARGAKLR
ncbi:MAG: hypothetical protein K6C40_14720 [Thermoguttaceae bacterium]|nr:hypothetical protein [Thermoguttaceae bacterium]